MNLIAKIQGIASEGIRISEDQVRSFMILVRKQLELTPDQEKVKYSTLNLFCNWSAHTAITQSLTGLQTLARINDAFVRVKNSTDIAAIQEELSRAIGFGTLQDELVSFLDHTAVKHKPSDGAVWHHFLSHLIEIIRDVPLAFPPTGKLSKAAQKIYNRIAGNPIKPGAGVTLITISRVDYGKLGVEGLGEMTCLLIRTEDTTTTVVPLSI